MIIKFLYDNIFNNVYGKISIIIEKHKKLIIIEKSIIIVFFNLQFQ
jgi:hypothetical protein